MIDLHSHLLPGVDDGSRSVAQSVRVLRAMAAQGVAEVCLTPHLLASQADAGIPPSYDAAFAALVAEAPAEIRLHRGVELMLDRPLSAVAAADRRLTLGGSRYLLVEFTRMISAPAATSALSGIVALGLLPVLAHPERYVSCSPAVVGRWKDVGAFIQIDATTLLRPTARGQRARALLAAGLGDILAADNHGDSRSLGLAVTALAAQDASPQADLLARGNPAAILADQFPESVPPATLRLGLLDRLKTMLDTDG